MIPFVAPAPVKLLSPRVRRVLLAALGGVLLPVTAWAQVSYTGTAATQNFGSQAIGSTSAAKTFSFSVAAGTTVGSIAVLTQGTPNLDFNSATGGTCTATTYASASNCTVKTTFKPKTAGLRMGAVVFFSAANDSGTVLGSVPVYGLGTGPQIAFGPGTGIAIDPTVDGLELSAPYAAVVDAVGNLYIADSGNNRVVEVPAGGGAATAIDPTVDGESLNVPAGIAIDGAGDLFIGDAGNSRLVELPAGGGAAIAIGPMLSPGTTLGKPDALAFDGAGDLFIADGSTGTLELPAGGGTVIAVDTSVNGEGAREPTGVAVDGAGDLFVSSDFNKTVVEVPAGGGAATAIDPTVNGEPLENPGGVSVDGAGDLFITDFYFNDSNQPIDNRIVEVPAGGGAAIAIDPKVNGESLYVPAGVSVDSLGNLFIADPGNSRVVELQRSQPPALSFPTPTDIGATDTTDGTKTVQVFNVGNAALEITALSYPADFPESSGGASACTGSTSLNAGQECDVPVEFTPEHGGPLGEDVIITDNTLNVAGTRQSIALSGTAKGADHFSLTTTASVIANAPFTITVTALSTSNQPVTSYDGTVAFTSSDPLFVNPGPLTLSNGTGQISVTLDTTGMQTISATDTVIPALTGSGGFVVSVNPAVLTTPTPSTTIGYSNVTFAWTPGYNVTRYYLTLGTAGAGSNNIYTSSWTAATSLVVAKLPETGATIYARLYSLMGYVWYHTDSTYTETTAVLATLNTPTPGTTLGVSNVTFAWNPATGSSNYQLTLGVSGPGSTDVYVSGQTTATSVVVPTLPATAVTIYARLSTQVGNVWQHNDYTYTTATPLLATLSTPNPGNTLGISNVTFSWNPGLGASSYQLALGVSKPGSTDVYLSARTTATSVVVPTLPATAVTLYARLFTEVSGVWQYNDYTYTTATPLLATMATPMPGSVLGTSNVTFTWNPGYGVSIYELTVGLSGPGSTDIYVSGQTTATSAVVPKLPSTGATIYVRLITKAAGIWQHNDYTYTAAP